MVKLNASVHPSLSETVTENLRRRNMVTTADFIAADSVELAAFTGLSHAEILQVKQHILKEFGYTKRSGLDLFVAEKNVISTGVTCLDELLRGGLCPGCLCELCGSSSSGKTQLCLTIVANVAATQSDIIVWYFDTKKDFSRLRFEEILKARNFGQEIIKEAMQHTKVCHVHSFSELIQDLRQLLALYKTEKYSLKEKRFLVIIDSLTAIIFETTRQMQQKTCESIYQLDELAEVCRFLIFECRATVVTVNSVSRWNSTNGAKPADVTPALGKYWIPIPATRLLLARQQHGEIRKITVLRDPRVKWEDSCTVNVCGAGVTSR
ncbi:DNA repair protein RAD51 homolog 4 [Harpegnathos saltator]|uniref:DNA repair protein RAD51 homolog 4 n=1 Tax=Harpegnathos saltator TaxID=610380 RepID=UPI000DBEE384|nr:DNA repair protein RAD51 homolog 4 [Harpegnathos saltator]